MIEFQRAIQRMIREILAGSAYAGIPIQFRDPLIAISQEDLPEECIICEIQEVTPVIENRLEAFEAPFWIWVFSQSDINAKEIAKLLEKSSEGIYTYNGVSEEYSMKVKLESIREVEIGFEGYKVIAMSWRVIGIARD